MLENKGLNTKELIEELDNQLNQIQEEKPSNQKVDKNSENHDYMDFDFNELENMDPHELREKLNDK